MYTFLMLQLANRNDDKLKMPSVDDFISLVQSKLTTKKETGVEVNLDTSISSFTFSLKCIAFIQDAKNVRIGRVLSYIALAYTQKDNDVSICWILVLHISSYFSIQLSTSLPKIIPDLLVIRAQETRRRLRAFIDASIVQLAKWVNETMYSYKIILFINKLSYRLRDYRYFFLYKNKT